MNDLTDSTLEAMLIGTLLMGVSAWQPQIGAWLGALLLVIGVIALLKAYESSKASHAVFAVISLAFGVAVELASVETLAILVFVAMIADALLYAYKKATKQK